MKFFAWMNVFIMLLQHSLPIGSKVTVNTSQGSFLCTTKTVHIEPFLGCKKLWTQRACILSSTAVVKALMLLEGLGISGKVTAAQLPNSGHALELGYLSWSLTWALSKYLFPPTYPHPAMTRGSFAALSCVLSCTLSFICTVLKRTRKRTGMIVLLHMHN